MNYLAHLYLSSGIGAIAAGNFMGDGIKGAVPTTLPTEVRIGIHLHRFIDTYTDDHPVSAAARRLLHPHFSKYAGVVLDMVYDHFLAVRWSEYSDQPLDDFVKGHFDSFAPYLDFFPSKSLRLYEGMSSGDWIQNYATIDGMDRSFRGLSRRTRFDSGMEKGAAVLVAKYDRLGEAFAEFFDEAVPAVAQELDRLLKSMLTHD